MMQIKCTQFPGCYELIPQIQRDQRGCFVKTFNYDFYREHNLSMTSGEEYYSTSRQGVLRGLHFQLPPVEHLKTVYCVLGEVMDVVVDLRVGSPAYGQYAIFNLTHSKANMLYIPAGLAHGFYVLSTVAILMYKVTTVFAPEKDAGIRWNSLGIPWPDHDPIVSVRDQGLVEFRNFRSPFIYHDAEEPSLRENRNDNQPGGG